MNIINKRILIFQQRNWGLKFGRPIAEHFNKMGAQIGALTFKYHKNYVSDSEVKYSWIESHDKILENPKKYLLDFNCSLETICKDLDVDTIWPYVQSLRDHVKSYREKFYYSFKQNVADDDIIIYIKAIYKLLLEINKSFKPHVIIMPNFVSLIHIMTYFFFKKRNIRCLSLTTSGLKDHYIFTNDFLDTTGSFFDQLKIYKKNMFNIDFSKEAIQLLQKETQKLINMPDIIYIRNNFLNNLVKFIYQFFLNLFRETPAVSKLYGVKADQEKYLNKYLLRSFVIKNYNIYKSNKIKYYKLENLNNFAYMPLQFQPESNLDVASANFNNQIETARQIAMHLPDDMTLVVKDHPAMTGLRSSKYLEKILKTPNVKLIKYNNSSASVLKKSSLLIAPTGTTFFEAAILKKPAIVLGNLGIVKILPNVVTTPNYQSLPFVIKKILNLSKSWGDDYNSEILIIISAILKKGISSNYIKLWETQNNKEDLNNIINKFSNEVLDILNKV